MRRDFRAPFVYFPVMETERLPWVFGIVTAAWFGWLANRAGRSRALWAVGGGAFGLVLSAMVIGLGTASTIPYSEQRAGLESFAWIAIATLLIVAAGWVLTAGLHRHPVLLEQPPKPSFAAPPMPSEPRQASPPQNKGPTRPSQ
jgi:hypothetical protein